MRNKFATVMPDLIRHPSSRVCAIKTLMPRKRGDGCRIKSGMTMDSEVCNG
jgi:hypothetical protein